MSAWLAVACIAVVFAAAVGMVPLRRYADRQWAEHVRRQRIAALPEFQRVAESFVQVQITLRDAFTPALMRAAAAAADFARAFDAAIPPRPWWRRALDRLAFWRWTR